MEGKVYDSPFIHLFQTVSGTYFYDVNKDKCVPVPGEIYEYLEKGNDELEPEEKPEYIRQLEKDGFLKIKRVERIKHSNSEILPYHLKNKIRHLILQVTQNCNLRCEYCVYSGDYQNRTHSQKKMSFDVAKKAMDYYLSHSRDNNSLSMGFYGGEPCLNFELVKKCVEYFEEKAEGRTTAYNMTTNATLLSEDIIDYIVKHDFSLMISLDGPREVHDKHRKLAFSEEGSFDRVMKKVEYLKERYPEYCRSHVSFNCVLDTENDFEIIDHFIKSSPLISDMKIRSSVIDTRNTDKSYGLNEKFLEEMNYERFKIQLELLGELPTCSGSRLLSGYKSSLTKALERADGAGSLELPDEWHHGGPCMPGAMRLFVNAEGIFYPCERVNEENCMLQIGNVEEGIDVQKAEHILNFDEKRKDICRNCWAFRRCSQCVSYFEGDDVSSAEKRENHCKITRKSVEEDMKDVCVLQALKCNYLVTLNA